MVDLFDDVELLLVEDFFDDDFLLRESRITSSMVSLTFSKSKNTGISYYESDMTSVRESNNSESNCKILCYTFLFSLYFIHM